MGRTVLQGMSPIHSDRLAVADFHCVRSQQLEAGVWPCAASIRSTIDEYRQGGASRKQAASLTNFADKPLIVLTAGNGHDATWSAAQDQLATLSTNSVHRIIAGATHASLVGEEKPATATTQAILDVVSAVRHPGPLRK